MQELSDVTTPAQEQVGTNNHVKGSLTSVAGQNWYLVEGKRRGSQKVVGGVD